MQGWNPHAAHLWPTASDQLLLRAAVLHGDAAVLAWRAWRATHEIAAADLASQALLPRIYCNLEAGELDAADRGALRAAYRETWTRNHAVLHHLLDVLRRFARASIDAMVLKGVPLALLYYRDLGARVMADVDVLIRADDLGRAADVLAAAGWRMEGSLPPASIAAAVRAVAWAHPQGLLLDLHWRPFEIDCPIDVEEAYWQRAHWYDVRDVRMRVPSPDDLLLLMCFHGRRQDPQARARWIVDALAVIAAADPPVDWRAVLRRSEEAGLLPPVRDALGYLRREFSVDIAEEILQHAAAIPAEAAESRRYRELAGLVPTAGVGLLGRFWWRYAAAYRSRRAPVPILGFVGFYLSYKQWQLRRRSRWPAAWHAIRRMVAKGMGR